MRRSSLGVICAIAALACLSSAQVAFGHPGHVGTHGTVVSGLLHPVLGADHLLAALCSGLLAVRIGSRRALWAVPLSFVGLMIAGGALAAAGLALPVAEWGIALSVLVLGTMVAAMPSIPLGVGATLVGLFAVCHGHAHVSELSTPAVAPYMIGFAIATLLIHTVAIGAGLLAKRLERPIWIRAAGATLAALFFIALLAS
jgi:urease accessory protein